MSRRSAITAAVVALCGGAVLVGLGAPRVGAWYVEARVLPRVAARLGRTVGVGGVAIELGASRVRLAHVVVAGGPGEPALLTARRVVVQVAPWAALFGGQEVLAIDVEEPHVTLLRRADGSDNFRDLLDRVRARRGGSSDGPGAPRPRLAWRSGLLTVDDRVAELKLAATEVSGEALPSRPVHAEFVGATLETALGPRAGAGRIVVDLDPRDPWATARLQLEDGHASLSPRLALSGITGTVTLAADRRRAKVALAGGYGGAQARLWRADGWVEPSTRRADLHLEAEEFTLDKLAAVLTLGIVPHPAKATLSAVLDVRVDGARAEWNGTARLRGLEVKHAGLADKPVVGIDFDGRVRGSYQHDTRILELGPLEVDFRGVAASVTATLALRRGLDESAIPRTESRLVARLSIPPVPCQLALDAIPAELTPRLRGFRLRGTFSADLAVAIDWADLDATRLTGSIGIGGCKVLGTPTDAAPQRLLGEFEHSVEVEPERWLDLVVGPTNPDFVPLDEVSPFLVRSLMTTEDNNFFEHKGFITREFRSALVKNLKARRFAYGASSITMQFVKNVLLHREKTLSRKLQELFLTWYVEQALPKDRILEIYLNVIEYGPALYGIGPAAARYFGKHPRDLLPIEAAFFSSILPAPKQRYLQYCTGAPNRWGAAKITRVLGVMRTRDRLTEEEYRAALATPLAFHYPEGFDAAQCRRDTLALIERTKLVTPEPPAESDESDESDEN
ncbi:MAG: DUF748 domain-containing protein [Myxococcales bacterium]|nr:DUF748 domain-containing protein [Myxococcales bacterium]